MNAVRHQLEPLMLKRGEVDSHPGLLLQRYLHESAVGEEGKSEHKRQIIDAAIKSAANADVLALYKSAYQRWQQTLPTTNIVLQTEGRLIVGLGSENVLETGIWLHHTYGLPTLPGSALKGLAAHYCDQVWGQRDNSDPSDDALKFRGPRKADRSLNRTTEPHGVFHKLLFGANDESGCIVFHDGWFVPDSDSSPLKLDVMTPHHPKWLDGSEPPTDFDSPIPIPFLSVAGKFHIAVAWYGPERDQANDWTKLALSLLTDALKNWGIGGKTSSGYGRLDVPPPPPPPEPYKGKSGESVDAVLLTEKTKKGGWRAQIKGHSQSGPVQNNDAVSSDVKEGNVVQLLIASINDREVAFKWPPTIKK